MPTRISEDTEITLSIREIAAIIIAVVTVTGIIVRYESKIDSMTDDIDKLKSHIQHSAAHMIDTDKILNQQQIETVKQQKDIEYIKQTLRDTQSSKK
jgi:hypothetical protein